MSQPLSFQKQLKLAEHMLFRLDKLEPQKYRDFLRRDLEKTISILKQNMANMMKHSEYRKLLKQHKAFRRAHRGSIQ